MTTRHASFDERAKGPSYRGLEGDRQTKATRDTGADDLHWSNLWDENEDRAGQRADEATGKPIDNSTFTDQSIVMRSGGSIVELGEDGDEAVLEDWEQPLDELEIAADALTDAWMAAAIKGVPFDVETFPADTHTDQVA